jgi:hypothetical protein
MAIHTLEDMREHPENLVPQQEQAGIRKPDGSYVAFVYCVYIPDATGQAQERVAAETPDELISCIKTRAGQNLDQLSAKRTALEQELTKANTIIGAFAKEIQGLMAKRQELEGQLLQEGGAAEPASPATKAL